MAESLPVQAPEPTDEICTCGCGKPLDRGWDANQEPQDHPGEVLAARLREGRRALGLTQEDVAAAVGIPRTGVSDMEAGARNVTGLELRRLARLYRRSVGWLLGEVADADVDPDLVAVASRLTPHDRDTVLRFARFLASQHPEVSS